MRSFKNVCLALALVFNFGAVAQVSAASIALDGDFANPTTPDAFQFEVLSDGDLDLVRDNVNSRAGLELQITLTALGSQTGVIYFNGFDNVSFTAGIYSIVFANSGGEPGKYYYDLIGNVAAVPLPAAAWLFGSAILGLTVVARRRRTSSVAEKRADSCAFHGT